VRRAAPPTRARCGAQSPPVYPPGQSCALRTRIIPGRRQAPTSTAWSCERGPRDHSDVTRLNRAVGRPRDGPDAGPQIRPRPTRDPPPNSQPHRPLGCPAARMCPQTRRPEYHIKPEAALWFPAASLSSSSGYRAGGAPGDRFLTQSPRPPAPSRTRSAPVGDRRTGTDRARQMSR
jgi:hypothetical protein